MSYSNRRNHHAAVFIASLTFTSFAVADAEPPNRTDLSEACELAVAVSALPKRLRDDATVYVLDGSKYRIGRRGAGPMTCVVERNHTESLVPQCMDKAGVNSVLPAIILRSEMIVGGASTQQSLDKEKENLERNLLQPAKRPGVSYMMSDYNYSYVQSTDSVQKIAPHVMFYAPHLSNEDIGGSFQGMIENIGTPFVFNEGIHGYMIVYTQYRADPNDVLHACKNQLGESPPQFDPFPKG